MTPIDLVQQYLFLDREGRSTELVGGEAFWSQPADALEQIGQGWLVSEYVFGEDWVSWEMHPHADEVVYLLDGDVEVHLESAGQSRVIRIANRGTLVIPKGMWHTMKVARPSRMLHITMGEGTQHRPVHDD